MTSSRKVLAGTLAGAYLIGLLVCWLSYYVVAIQNFDGYANMLFWLVLGLELRVRGILRLFLVEQAPSPHLAGAAMLVSSTTAALLFPLAYLAIQSQNKRVRWFGIMLIVVLGIFTLMWLPVPRVF